MFISQRKMENGKRVAILESHDVVLSSIFYKAVDLVADRAEKFDEYRLKVNGCNLVMTKDTTLGDLKRQYQVLLEDVKQIRGRSNYGTNYEARQAENGKWIPFIEVFGNMLAIWDSSSPSTKTALEYETEEEALEVAEEILCNHQKRVPPVDFNMLVQALHTAHNTIELIQGESSNLEEGSVEQAMELLKRAILTIEQKPYGRITEEELSLRIALLNEAVHAV